MPPHDRQERDLLEYAAKAGYQVARIWKETATGTKQNRVEQQKVLVLAQIRKIDAISVTEMTRWGRSNVCSKLSFRSTEDLD